MNLPFYRMLLMETIQNDGQSRGDAIKFGAIYQTVRKG